MGAPHPYFRILSEEFAGHGRKFAKVASDVFEIGMIVGLRVGVGTIRPHTAADIPLGICAESIQTTHTNYAATTPIDVEMVLSGAEVWCPVSVGTPALTSLGYFADIVADGLSITLSTSSYDDFCVVSRNGESTTEVICTPAGAGAYPFAYA